MSRAFHGLRMMRRAEIISAMTVFFRLVLMIFALHLVPPAGAAAGQTVTVFAAASLQTALNDAVAAYDGDVVVSYGGSGQIARQVAQGAPADVIILANTAWMDWLETETSVTVRNRLNLLGNTLVLVAPKGADPLPEISADAMLGRLAGGRLAIGQTRGVPAGIYGRQWLENAGFWEVMAPYLAETENVRAALALVARGEAPLGLVYASDAQADDRVVTLYAIPGTMHDPIVYPMAEIGERSDPQISDFMSFISSDVGQEFFLAQGFAKPVEQP